MHRVQGMFSLCLRLAKVKDASNLLSHTLPPTGTISAGSNACTLVLPVMVVKALKEVQ